jgi:4-hydroxy 2-oxovalerate aldolase
MKIKLLDCTLRDGANVVGKGFSEEITKMVLEGLINSNITTIEFGNAGGIGAYEVADMIAPLTDLEYLELAQPYIEKADIGMFLNAKRFRLKDVELAAEKGMKFLRVGAEPRDGNKSIPAIKAIKKFGLKARYALMKAYLVSPYKLAEEAKMLQDNGVDEITIMDSAGTMSPDEVAAYCDALVSVLEIPVGFHGHNNLGFSAANAVVAYENGASVLDCSLMGMARSAGNFATENAVIQMKQMGELEEVDLYKLLEFIDLELAPAMEKNNYYAALKPIDLILGYAGAHSSFLNLFKKVAIEKEVNLYELIYTVSKLNRRDPSESQMLAIAEFLKEV